MGENGDEEEEALDGAALDEMLVQGGGRRAVPIIVDQRDNSVVVGFGGT